LFTALGDKPTASATDSSGNCRKKKLAACQRSYEKQNPENQHLYLKPFRSDPTNSSSCGHLALASKLSEYKYKPGHVPDSDKSQVGVGHVESRPRNNEDKPEKLHQQLKRQLAIKGNNDPRASNLARPYNVNYVAERSGPDVADAPSESLVNVTTSDTDISTSSTRNNSTDTTLQLDTDSSLPCASQTKPELTQRPIFNDARQFFAARRSGQDQFTGDRFASPIAAPATGRVDNNMCVVRPVIFPYNYTTDLHSYEQFSAPPMFPRIMSPRGPQMFVCQPRSYLPQNGEMRPPVRPITLRRFLHR